MYEDQKQEQLASCRPLSWAHPACASQLVYTLHYITSTFSLLYSLRTSISASDLETIASQGLLNQIPQLHNSNFYVKSF